MSSPYGQYWNMGSTPYYGKEPLELFDTETAIAELKAAGWIPDGYQTRWKAPNGTLWRGPAGAWRVMKRQESERQR